MSKLIFKAHYYYYYWSILHKILPAIIYSYNSYAATDQSESTIPKNHVITDILIIFDNIIAD